MFVTYDIAAYLKRQGIESKLYTTKLPDIVFEINGKKIAIEVETGSQTILMKRLREKVKSLNKKYDYWFFVVTNRNYAPKYRKLGKTIEMRYLDSHLRKVLRTVTKNSSKK